MPEQVLPPEVTGPIFEKAADKSVIARLSGNVPVPIGGIAVPVNTQKPEVGVVGEGQEKPVSNVGGKFKMFKPVKLATIVVVSEAFARANVGGTYSRLSDDLADAVARGVDLLTLHGRSPIDGTRVPDKEYIDQTSNRVVLGSTPRDEGGIAGDFIAGYELIVNDESSDDFTGFAMDKRLRPRLMGATDVQGRPLLQTTANLADPLDVVLGLPAAYARAVSGRVGASPDTSVRAYGGDWTQVRYGFAEEMTLRVSTEATLMIDGEVVSLWQRNLVGLLIECWFAWAIGDVNAFAAYEMPGS
ncbi:phage major capsid protein [Actinokineospora auranticolor]|uniref:phage major capsid protein n=1 Tax=Actinokineospora auranticolor TaxID=155976 RepID=UPI002481AA6E|nr:phage major capsid protein [Actinokineospora auranticolor]